MLYLLQLLIYLAALAGIVASTLGMIYYAGAALNVARPAPFRRRRAMLAALCLCGIAASAALGFLAIPALLYLASA